MKPSISKTELETSSSAASIFIRLRATETPKTDLIASSLEDVATVWTSALAAPCWVP